MHDLFREVAVIPVLTIEREADGVPLGRALFEGGLRLVEVTLRTPAAPAAIAAIIAEKASVIPQILGHAASAAEPVGV